MHNGGGAYRHCRIYSPPPPLGGEFGHGEGYGYGYYGGRYGGGGRGYDDFPLGRHPRGASYGGLACYDGMDCLVGTVRGLGIGMNNGGAAPGSALGVGEFDFGDASPQFPAAPDTLRGDSLYGLPKRWPWQRYNRK